MKLQRFLWRVSPPVVDYIREELAFPHLRQAAVMRKTFSDGRAETWFLLTSLPPEELTPQAFLQCTRKHWQIENGLHHVKDRTLREDQDTTRSIPTVNALTLLRNMTVSLWNRLTPPAKRKKSRPCEATGIKQNPLQILQRLYSL